MLPVQLNLRRFATIMTAGNCRQFFCEIFYAKSSLKTGKGKTSFIYMYVNNKKNVIIITNATKFTID